MDFLDAIPVIGPILGAAIPFLIVLGVVVFVHEYGHYIVGRWAGIQAETFSIGFGRPLLSWRDRRGTTWQIAAIPLGGFVKFVGDMNPASAGEPDTERLSEEQKTVAFHTAPLGARAATVVAGPVANFLLSIVIFAGLALAVGQQSDRPVIADTVGEAGAEVGFQPGDRVLSLDGRPIETFGGLVDYLHRSDGEPVTARVERDGRTETIEVAYSIPPEIQIRPGMPASQAGMAPGDRIVAINGEPISSFFDLQMVARELPTGEPVTVGVERGGERLDFTFVPETQVREDPVTGEDRPQATLGVVPVRGGGLVPPTVSIGPGQALLVGVESTWGIIATTVAYLGDMIFADADTSQLGGPLRIAEMSGDTAAQGMIAFLRLIAVLSTSIGFLNLLPIPVLDGGHLLFYAAEAVRGRPVRGAWLQIGTVIGLSLVLSLMVFATYNDISRLFAG